MEWQCFRAALFSLDDGSTTAKRPRRHLHPYGEIEHEVIAALICTRGPIPHKRFLEKAFRWAQNACSPSGVLVLTIGRTDQIAHDFVLADLRLWVKPHRRAVAAETRGTTSSHVIAASALCIGLGTGLTAQDASYDANAGFLASLDFRVFQHNRPFSDMTSTMGDVRSRGQNGSGADRLKY